MQWPRLLAYITGRVAKEFLVRNDYLAAENRILRANIKGRLQLSDGEKRTLAEIAHRLGRKALAEVAGCYHCRSIRQNQNDSTALLAFIFLGYVVATEFGGKLGIGSSFQVIDHLPVITHLTHLTPT